MDYMYQVSVWYETHSKYYKVTIWEICSADSDLFRGLHLPPELHVDNGELTTCMFVCMGMI